MEPHFLFNTLNNIYSLVYQKSDDAPDAVMKLSSIMRYMLYDSNTRLVPLKKEIEYINSYIELQKLRLKRKDFVELKISGEIENQMIVPMVFIAFVENAFKHGNKKVDSPGIVIDFQILHQKIMFEIMNFTGKDLNIMDATGGIGLGNIKRRLELSYPKKHRLEIIQSEDKYIVKLEISI